MIAIMAEAVASVVAAQVIPGNKMIQFAVHTKLRLLIRLFLFQLLVLFSAATAVAQKAVPELWGQRVHDEAHILKTTTIDSLEHGLKVYEDSTSNQIAILIIPSLDGEVLESYSLKVVEKWKLGQKGKDNGVLLLIAVDDHKIRIEVGQGLEGVLTDALSSRIIRNEIAPAFRRNEYDEGVTAAIRAITKGIAGEYKADDIDTSVELTLGERLGFGAFIFGILGLFTFFALFSSGCAGWGLYAFLIPFWSIFPMIVVGVDADLVVAVIYIIGMPIAKIILGRSAWGKSKMMQWKNSSGGGGSSWGGWSSSGSSWSDSGSSGGFSGGGGSFGGGGSSGGW